MNNSLRNEYYFEEIIFHMKKFKLLGEKYKESFYAIPDDAVVNCFNVQTTNFRFEQTNKTGKEIKDHIRNLELF